MTIREPTIASYNSFVKILTGLDGLRSLPPGTALSVGNFDGVHKGHRHILQTAKTVNDQSSGAGVAVVTFEPHPLTVLRPELAPPRLTTLPIKRKLLEEAGVDFLIELAPQRAVLDLTAEQFWMILRDQVRPHHIIEGFSFNFGKDRGGTIETLRAWSSQSDIQLHVIDPVETVLLDLSIVQVNSSLIRWLIGHGRVRDAAICLGRRYALEGEVITGHRRGRAIGVPTANIRPADQMVPLDGVYSGRCEVNGVVYPAAISIGTMPTFGQNEPQVEAHLIGFDGDLYGKTIAIEFVNWLREQRKFAGIEELKRQLQRDIAVASCHADHDASGQIATIA
jgi:riboflavin kinase / FMN adenylyltransferase